jgi:hypothetical protein
MNDELILVFIMKENPREERAVRRHDGLNSK